MCALALGISAAGCTNFGVVQDQKLYRSAQVDGDTLKRLIEENRIQTVLNLRGGSDRKDWYAEETAVCEALGIDHVTVRMSARRYPRTDELIALLDAFETARYPVLVHCHGGADRSGLASAIYRIVHGGDRVDDAEDELTLWYGHLGRLSGTGGMRGFLDLYRATGNSKPLRQWILLDYERELARREDPAELLRRRPTPLEEAARGAGVTAAGPNP